MPGNIEYIQFGENFIEVTADFLLKHYANDLDKVVCVFGGKRPGLFLRKALAKKIGRAFVGPKIISIDEYMGSLAEPTQDPVICSELDAAWYVYLAAQKKASSILVGNKTFAEFLPWAKEIVSFIEQLDLECVPDSALSSVQAVAKIGFDVPKSINSLLAHIVSIRKEYHRQLRSNQVWSRGLIYRTAVDSVNTVYFDQIKSVLLCGFFYLHVSERAVFKTLIQAKTADVLIHGDPKQWDVLKQMVKELGIEIKDELLPKSSLEPNIMFHEAKDTHAQIAVVADLLKKVQAWQDTVIVVPRPQAVVPLLTQIADMPQEFNVSLGYPLERTALVALFKDLARCQESRRNDLYYSKDYLRVLKHPLVKTARLGFDLSLTRVVCHKIEEGLTGVFDSSLGGTLFVSLSQLAKCRQIQVEVKETVSTMGIKCSLEDIEKVITKIHAELFDVWDNVETVGVFGQKLTKLLEVFAGQSMIEAYPFNAKVIEKLFDLAKQFERAVYSDHKMSALNVWDIFLRVLSNQVISFAGSPLQGLQILGLFETRSLDFKNVIIIDANETVLPSLKLHEPLIPREIMIGLGINRLEKEEEIQRYQFTRLIAAAAKVDLIYVDNAKNEKSRFLEELIWRKQKQENKYVTPVVPKYGFCCKISPKRTSVAKTPQLVEYLRSCEYSASRVNTYLQCPMQFYFQYALGLRETEDMLDQPQANTIGDFVHRLLEQTLSCFVGKKPQYSKEFEQMFFAEFEKRFDQELAQRMRADAFMLKAILKHRLCAFLEEERCRPIKEIISLEKETRGIMKLACQDVKFVCKVDRVDRMESGEILIIDYKTGSSDVSPQGLDKLQAMPLDRQGIKKTIKSLQMPIYMYFLKPQFANDPAVNAQLYTLKVIEHKPFIADKDRANTQEIMKICVDALNAIFTEMFDPNVDFVCDPDPMRCEKCPFIRMCG